MLCTLRPKLQNGSQCTRREWIRFDDHVDIDPVQYKRVSVRQPERNIERAARHNIYKHSTPTSIPGKTKDSLPEITNDQRQNNPLLTNSQDIHTNKKRKYSFTSPEIVRGNMMSSDPECILVPSRVSICWCLYLWERHQTYSYILSLQKPLK